MYLFGEDSNQGPIWAASAIAGLGVAYALFKFIYWLMGKRRTYRQEGAEAENKLQRSENEQKTIRRRDAATEAWQVVDQLNQIVQGHTARINELETKHGTALAAAVERTEECRREYAEAQKELGEMRGYVSVIVAWGRTKGLKIPPMPGDTDTHQALPSED